MCCYRRSVLFKNHVALPSHLATQTLGVHLTRVLNGHIQSVLPIDASRLSCLHHPDNLHLPVCPLSLPFLSLTPSSCVSTAPSVPIAHSPHARPYFLLTDKMAFPAIRGIAVTSPSLSNQRPTTSTVLVRPDGTDDRCSHHPAGQRC